MPQGPIGLRSKTYLGKPIEYSNFDFDVLSIARLESMCQIGILKKNRVNGFKDQ